MSAEVLRRAAAELRFSVRAADGDPRLVSNPEFNLAIADWLDNAADRLPYTEHPRPEMAHAEVVAVAYLGRTAS